MSVRIMYFTPEAISSELCRQCKEWSPCGKQSAPPTGVLTSHLLRLPGEENNALVAGAVEQREHSAGSLRLAVVPHASKDELGPFVRGVIDAPEATVLTDGLPAYAHLRPAGVDHRPEVQGDPTRAAEILPWIHTVFSNLKTWLRGTFHGVSAKHLARYLQEFTYRFDRRAREAELFHFVLRRAVGGDPLPYARLTAEVIG